MIEHSAALEPFGLVAALLAAVLLAAAAWMLAPGRRVALGASVSAVASATAVLLVSPGGDTVRLVGAVLAAASAGAIVGGVAGELLDRRAAIVVCAAIPAVAVGPLSALQLALVPPALELLVGALDIGGSIGRVAVPAAVVLGVTLALPAARAVEIPVRRARALGAAALAALAVAAGALAAEGSVGASTPSILVNLAIGAVLGTVTWMLVVRIAGRPLVALDAACGALAGAGAVSLGAALLLPVTAAAVASIAGFAGGAFRTRGRLLRGAAAGLLAALAAGGIVLGLLADGVGLAATGALTQAGAQLAGVVVVALLGVTVGAIAGLLGRVTGGRARAGEETVVDDDGAGDDDSPGEPGL